MSVSIDPAIAPGGPPVPEMGRKAGGEETPDTSFAALLAAMMGLGVPLHSVPSPGKASLPLADSSGEGEPDVKAPGVTEEKATVSLPLGAVAPLASAAAGETAPRSVDLASARVPDPPTEEQVKLLTVEADTWEVEPTGAVAPSAMVSEDIRQEFTVTPPRSSVGADEFSVQQEQKADVVIGIATRKQEALGKDASVELAGAREAGTDRAREKPFSSSPGERQKGTFPEVQKRVDLKAFASDLQPTAQQQGFTTGQLPPVPNPTPELPVAGASEEGGGALLAPAQFMEEVSRALVTAGPGWHMARLRLYPEHLGEVTVRVYLTGQEVHTVLEVSNAAAQEALRLSSEQLRQGLSQAGLTLTSFEVSTRQERRSFQERHNPDDEPPRSVGKPELRRRPAATRFVPGSSTAAGLWGGRLDTIA